MDFFIEDFIILKMGNVFLYRKHPCSGQEIPCLTASTSDAGFFCLFACESNLCSLLKTWKPYTSIKKKISKILTVSLLKFSVFLLSPLFPSPPFTGLSSLFVSNGGCMGYLVLYFIFFTLPVHPEYFHQQINLIPKQHLKYYIWTIVYFIIFYWTLKEFFPLKENI